MSERITSDHSRQRRKDEPEVSQEFPVETTTTEVAETDFDEVLAEIDGVLEANAEEFVNGFIQKGGQ